MKLKYQNKEIECQDCINFWERFRGFMLCKNIHQALLFRHCNSIHTFFMKEAIDVIFCNEENIVLYYYKDLKPNRVILPKRGVTRVYEVPTHYFDIQVSSQLEVE